MIKLRDHALICVDKFRPLWTAVTVPLIAITILLIVTGIRSQCLIPEIAPCLEVLWYQTWYFANIHCCLTMLPYKLITIGDMKLSKDLKSHFHWSTPPIFGTIAPFQVLNMRLRPSQYRLRTLST